MTRKPSKRRSFWRWLKGDPRGPELQRDTREEARMLGTHARDVGAGGGFGNGGGGV